MLLLPVDIDAVCPNPSVLLNFSNDDICRSGELPISRSSFADIGDNLELCLLTRLKFLSRAKALWFEVSERALRAGEGGDKSGRGKSCIGVFQ